MIILLLLISICATEKPFSISYTQKHCKAVALKYSAPSCYCIADCCNYTAAYPSVPVYKFNPVCVFRLYHNGGYECMCPESDRKVTCLSNKYQYFDNCSK